MPVITIAASPAIASRTAAIPPVRGATARPATATAVDPGITLGIGGNERPDLNKHIRGADGHPAARPLVAHQVSVVGRLAQDRGVTHHAEALKSPQHRATPEGQRGAIRHSNSTKLERAAGAKRLVRPVALQPLSRHRGVDEHH